MERSEGMEERLTLTRAITLLSWHFLHGEALTTMQVARMTGRSRSGAYRLLCEMSGAMPLVLYRGRWQLESMLEPEQVGMVGPFC